MKEIVFENVCKHYGKNLVVNHLNLTIRAGERLILLGPSGCGKSTTLRIISGLENISSGKLYMGGKCVNDVPSGDRNIAMVFQNYALFPHMTVEENITYGLKVHKVPKGDIEERLKSALQMLRLEGLEKRKPKELSGGQRQRVALARAVVKRSDFFLLDEPLSNLDAQLRGHARKELVKIHEMYRQTFVYVTHDQVEAMTIGDRVALMNKGVLQMVDTPDNVYNRPANVFTAKFIGAPAANVLDADYWENGLIVGKQKLLLPEMWIEQVKKSRSNEFAFGIRPEHIQLSKAPIANAFKGRVKYIENYGNRFGIYFEIEGNEIIAMADENDLSANDTVYFQPDFAKIHLFDRSTTNSIGYPKELIG
ncbi:ABC transporter ATP-binding protein [Geosporobacter ferrireducens]|uniref:Sugar ABC transporter ATP-binding protein n=1 Tax=Geosporobacter ferrireducens TaxID=1424294 RepID=A0A1D8GKQ1_9FIRM|nr:ABC transporter ATP-binding protein [Geosporobacter ferrireducens]AOT71479.1 sugar ABC transporter ATP-binding protein [Geosporobacter ferrireducens]MTI57789.1 ABC transporter ATP-binding protein [Geosporobacter ferrireducens]